METRNCRCWFIKITHSSGVTQRVKQNPWKTWLCDVSGLDPPSNPTCNVTVSMLPTPFFQHLCPFQCNNLFSQTINDKYKIDVYVCLRNQTRVLKPRMNWTYNCWCWEKEGSLGPRACWGISCGKCLQVREAKQSDEPESILYVNCERAQREMQHSATDSQ